MAVAVERPYTRECMLTLAAVLEARRALGSCEEIASLGGWDWTKKGPLPARRRLWQALLPGVRCLPDGVDEDGTLNMDFALALREVGAPRLVRLSIQPFNDSSQHFLPTIEALSSIVCLESLELGECTLDRPMVEKLAELMAAASPQPLFPSLTELKLDGDVIESHPDGPRDFVAAIARAAAEGGEFPRVKTLRFMGAYPPVAEAVAGAMTAGAFPRLEELRAHGHIGSAGFLSLVRALETAPCARSLNYVTFGRAGLEGATRLSDLGALIGAGRLPSLKSLDLSGNNLGHQGVVAFFEALARAFAAARAPVAGLEDVSMDATGMADAGISAFARALEAGALGSSLNVLALGSAGDVGVAALTRAFAGGGGSHVAQLRTFHLGVEGASHGAVESLRHVVGGACPWMDMRGWPRPRTDSFSGITAWFS